MMNRYFIINTQQQKYQFRTVLNFRTIAIPITIEVFFFYNYYKGILKHSPKEDCNVARDKNTNNKHNEFIFHFKTKD